MNATSTVSNISPEMPAVGGKRKKNNATQMGGKRKKNNANQMGGRRKTRKNNVSQMGGAKKRAVGSHAEVWHQTAHHTSGGLEKHNLMKNKHGRIVSRKKHALGKKALKNLVKAGYKAKKGTFKLFKR